MIPSDEKHLIDMASIWALFGVFSDILPVFALFLTVVWTMIRIYETDTVQKILRKREKDGEET